MRPQATVTCRAAPNHDQPVAPYVLEPVWAM